LENTLAKANNETAIVAEVANATCKTRVTMDFASSILPLARYWEINLVEADGRARIPRMEPIVKMKLNMVNKPKSASVNKI
jgi:hypothetical protein